MLAAFVLNDTGLLQSIAHEPVADLLCGADPRLFSVFDSECPFRAWGVLARVSAFSETSSVLGDCVFSCLRQPGEGPGWLFGADMMSLCSG